MGRLRVVENIIDGPESVERTLLLDDEPVAVVLIDPREQDVTLVWGIARGSRLLRILTEFFSTFFEKGWRRNVSVGFWIDDAYQEQNYDYLPTAMDIVSDIEEATPRTGNVRLLNIHATDMTLEIVFDFEDAQPSRIAIFTAMKNMHAIFGFFTAFHANAVIRHDWNSNGGSLRPVNRGIITETGFSRLFPVAGD